VSVTTRPKHGVTQELQPPWWHRVLVREGPVREGALQRLRLICTQARTALGGISSRPQLPIHASTAHHAHGLLRRGSRRVEDCRAGTSRGRQAAWAALGLRHLRQLTSVAPPSSTERAGIACCCATFFRLGTATSSSPVGLYSGQNFEPAKRGPSGSLLPCPWSGPASARRAPHSGTARAVFPGTG